MDKKKKKEIIIGDNIKKWYQFASGNRVTDIIILIILAIIGHCGWFKPGLLDFGDLWAIPKEVLVKFFSFPYIWVTDSYLGAYDSLLFKYPRLWLSGLVAYLGFDYSVIQRMIYFFPYLFFSIFSMYYFTYVLFKKRTVCFFATLFFVFNTGILQLVAFGIVDSAIAYALCPLILAFFVKGLRQKQLKYGILSGIVLSLSIAYYPPAAYLTIGAILLFFIDALISQIKSHDGFVKKHMIKLICYLIFVLIIPVILHFYWILPALLIKAPKVIPGHESVGWVYALSYEKLSHALSLYSMAWPPDSPSFPIVPLQYFAIPLIVLIGILSRLKDKNVRLLAIIAVISVFFAKGTNKPFGEVYAWFFKYFPGGSMFRTPGKFHCLTKLAYAPLLGVGIDFLANFFRKIELRKLKMPFKRNILKPIFLVFMLCFMIYLVFPAFQGKLGGTFDARQVPEEYEKIKKFIKSQPPHFRTFWRPHKGRYAFYSQEYPRFCAYQYHFYSSVGSRYFLSEGYNPKAFEQTEYIAKILGILNIKYCFLPLEKEYLFRGKEFYLETFEKQIGLKKINIGKNIDVFENQYFAPRFFATERGALVVGGRKALFLLASLEGMDFSRRAIFFADELKDDSRDLLSNIETIIFYDKDINDLVLALVGERYRVDLTKYVIPRSDDETPGRWVKIVFLPEHSSDGVITHNSKGLISRHAFGVPSELNTPVPVNIKEAGDYEIWLRPVKGPNRGKLSVIASKDVGMKKFTKQVLLKEDLKDKADSLQWIKAGTFYLDKGRHFFQIIHHSGPQGMVDQFIVIPKKIIDSSRQDISNILQVKDVILIKEPDNLSTDINIPKEGRYHIVANISNHNFSGDLSINLNGNKIKEKKLSNKDKSLWIETEAVSLKDGVSNIVISKQGNGEIELKQVVLYKFNLPISSIRELFTTEERTPVMWKMVNPTKYEVKLKTEKPTYLVFSERFDPHWTLNLKEPLHSISAYSLINSFFIDQPGEIEAILEFTPQRYVYKGLWVSGIGLALICFYFFYQGVGSLGKKRKN